jgi:hypothetical protein
MGQMIPLEAGINEVKVYVGEEKKISSNKITIIPPLRAIGRK